MWENSAWEIGLFDGRLDRSDSEVEPYLSIGGVSVYPGVPPRKKGLSVNSTVFQCPGEGLFFRDSFRLKP